MSEITSAVVPVGTKYLGQHLINLYDDDALFRVADYHEGMAAAIILDPERHLSALAESGVVERTKKGYYRVV